MQRGKEGVEAEILSLGQAIIVEELSKIKSFRQSIKRLAEQYSDVIIMTEVEESLTLTLDMGKHHEKGPEAARRIEQYASNLLELANSFNLRCGWILDGLHYIVAHEVDLSRKVEIGTFSIAWGIDRLKLDIPIYTNTRKQDIQRIFDQEWAEIKAKHPELQMRKRVPNLQGEFSRDVKWLCRRLFYGDTGKIIYTDGLENRKKSWAVDTINTAIGKAAKLLDIKLPRGRPLKHKKKLLKHWA